MIIYYYFMIIYRVCIKYSFHSYNKSLIIRVQNEYTTIYIVSAGPMSRRPSNDQSTTNDFVNSSIPARIIYANVQFIHTYICKLRKNGIADNYDEIDPSHAITDSVRYTNSILYEWDLEYTQSHSVPST